MLKLKDYQIKFLEELIKLKKRKYQSDNIKKEALNKHGKNNNYTRYSW
jgi:hypothetical protein